MKSENLSETEGNLKQREMHHCLRGIDAPGYLCKISKSEMGIECSTLPNMKPYEDQNKIMGFGKIFK